MSAVAEVPLNPLPTPASPNWLQRLSALDRAQRMRLGAGVALLVAAAVAAVVMGRQPDYRVLFSNLGDKDGGAVVAQLSQMNVPYKYSEGGGAILIPAERVHDVRLRLATQGLPKGSVAGFELMESNKFGMTQFQERLNFQRGLEGELTRSIQALSSVQSARVHLALPNQNGFFREQQKPSASVLVSLHPGRILDRAQLAGIVHLVASSVPELAPSAVSVLDDTGKLLSQSPDSTAGAEINAQQLLYVQQLEQQYSRRIMDILEPVVGRDNVKAQVTAEVDFSQTESTSEQFRPNQTPDSSAVRSQQVLESRGSSTKTATGVPGAVANQPPAPSAAPINGANPAPNAGGQQGTEEQTNKRESTTNYEVDKTVKVVRGSTGAVKRLSAAVVVNYQSAEDKGKTVTKALTPEQIEQMTALVRETIGFNRERGDSVNLMNTPFQVTAVPTTDTPLWKQPEVVDLAKTFAWPVGAVLFAALVLMGLVRPALKGSAPAKATAAKPVAGGQLDALEAETPERPALAAPSRKDEVLPATPEQLRLEDARVLAKENPVAVANILKTWLNGDPA
ncbi:flagellar M-ring protein FliF [Acidovorax delafieldii]|uniref:Flagellar M-ring protein n=1 Tax=Acidovorax delafieldii TaxID=47920 RepID=A0AAJ2F2Z1_ACIDE|nr:MULTISPECIES: flagellar basal-body MS-ring/collar protein FliF [Acidovorax]ODS77891.1 MAG: flagellar M-ring protein FliF [Acidovorax sp. SCN 65-28]MBN9626589.1 flagellar M-ring protein FliF [Acidovorax sp.]MDR6769231.1 flagellar M-ring protein FliF [Acidovorax delafieldii]MDR6839608.1 flagellar M-ring protein FliF [Acidovorax delafieldii]MDR7369159.1 flagellar M-ring protein FliF [Acidovorax delafieldii]